MDNNSMPEMDTYLDSIGEQKKEIARREEALNSQEHASRAERELTTGLLAKDASFRLIVSGKIGAKEIDRLIAKLKLDKEILADETEADPAENEDPAD